MRNSLKINSVNSFIIKFFSNLKLNLTKFRIFFSCTVIHMVTSQTLQWHCIDTAMTHQCHWDGIEMTLQWNFIDTAMTFQWHCNDISMSFQWHCNDILMTLQWHFNETSITFWWCSKVSQQVNYAVKSGYKQIAQRLQVTEALWNAMVLSVL